MEPIRLKINNFYSIASGEIEFSKFSSALILGYYENNILMSNGAGKSSVFEALCWVLFNETRQTKIDDVIRWTTNETSVEFEFIFDHREYKILRRRSRIAKESSVSLFAKENGKWVNDSGSINSETNKKILNLLKIDAKIFLNSVYFKQHDISLFANANPSERKDIIKAIMKLEKWDEYQKQAKNRLRTIKEDIDRQLHIVHDNPNLAVENKRVQNAIAELNDDLSKNINEQKNIQIKLNSLYEIKQEKSLYNLVNELNANLANIDELKMQGKKMQHTQGELQSQLENNNETSRQYAQKLLELNNSFDMFNKEIVELNKNDIDYLTLEHKILDLKVSIGKIQAELDELNNVSIELGQCQSCLTDITEENLPHIHNKRQDRFKYLTKQYSELNDALTLIDNDYKQRKETKEKIDTLNIKIADIQNSLDRIKTQKEILDKEIIRQNNDNITMSTSLVAIIDKIKKYKINVEGIERKIAEQKINNIDAQIKDLEDKAAEIRDNVNLKNIQLGLLLKEKELVEDKILQVNKATDTLSKLGQDKISYEQLVRAFGKEGIQALFIETVVDELEYYANETLSHICNEPTIIKLRTQKKTGDSWQETLEIDVMMNGFPQTFESLGGGERFRISLALRIGLSEVLVKRAGGEIKLLLLDEVDSPLDTYGLNNLFENIVKGLEKRFKILVISHNDKLKDRFNDIITVNKTNNGSFVQLS